MAKIELEITDSEVAQLQDAANSHETTPVELAARWIRERLVHERERATGGGRPMSPRARRAEDRH